MARETNQGGNFDVDNLKIFLGYLKRKYTLKIRIREDKQSETEEKKLIMTTKS